jgi:hypothetical protein
MGGFLELLKADKFIVCSGKMFSQLYVLFNSLDVLGVNLLHFQMTSLFFLLLEKVLSVLELKRNKLLFTSN